MTVDEPRRTVQLSFIVHLSLSLVGFRRRSLVVSIFGWRFGKIGKSVLNFTERRKMLAPMTFSV
jgi:hypothetical protein